MTSDNDISSIVWTEESPENKSCTDTNSSATDSHIKEEIPTNK
jgi:hypothetical protein